MPQSEAVSFLAFFRRWADIQHWDVPPLHERVCIWLAQEDAPERVLMVFRGAAKSTLYAIYKAWKLWRKRPHRSLVWSADGPTAGMLTADVINVLRNHPWCAGMLPSRPGSKRFWVIGATDARNASMRANGVNSNATGARADDVDFDDIEVPGNIETSEARLKLRQRIGESVHIAAPGGQKTYIGTPHTHDSIYPEIIAGGAAVLKIPLFSHVRRVMETRKETRYTFNFPVGSDGLYVIAGIHDGARVMVDGVDYRIENNAVVFPAPPGMVIDICAGCAWPKRFTREEIEIRRKQTRTLNGWDSQYQLEAKPIIDVRLDPERITPYAMEPRIVAANGGISMWLGSVRIAGASLRWDPASGKVNSDVSALAMCLQDESGRRYLHRCIALRGDLVEFAPDGKKITGGQVNQICDMVAEFQLPRVTIETNGIGQFAKSALLGALRQRRLICGVSEVVNTDNKNKRILESLEPLLLAARQLWAHKDVLSGPLWDQMKDWNPALRNQADDYLDAASGAVSDQPERIQRAISTQTDGAIGWIAPEGSAQTWHPHAGDIEVEVEY